MRLPLVLPVVLLIAPCSGLGPQIDILDAADIYRKHSQAYNSIRNAYPGPYTAYGDGKHISTRSSSNALPEDMAFLTSLRAKAPLKSITLYRELSGDVILISLANYGLSVSGSSVGLTYYENADGATVKEDGKAVYDSCDERSLAWLRADHSAGYAYALCRVDEHWFAWQMVS